MIKLKKLLKESEGLSAGEKFGLKEVGEQIVQTHKRLNELLFRYMNGVKKYHSKHRKSNPELAKKLEYFYKHLKGSYYYTTKQAAGKYLSNFQKTFRGLTEGKVPYKQIGTNKNDGYILHGKDIPVEEAIGRGMKWEDLKSGTSIEFTGGTTYVVTKIDKNKLQMSLKRRGKTGGGLFAPRAKLDKSQFESQVKVGLIKYLTNTNPRIKEGKLNEEKWIVASIYGDLYTPKAVPEKQAKKLMMKLAKQYAGDNVFMLGVKAWNKPHKYNKKKIKVKEGKPNIRGSLPKA